MCTTRLHKSRHLTPRSRVLSEKLTGPQLVKRFPQFYGTRKFITTSTKARHLSLLRANHVIYLEFSAALEQHLTQYVRFVTTYLLLPNSAQYSCGRNHLQFPLVNFFGVTVTVFFLSQTSRSVAQITNSCYITST
jgi:hypothetical protein